MKNAFPNRKDSIILTAIEIISDLGIQGLSTKELAKRQDITESLLYRHFKSKDDIVVAVLEYYTRFDQIVMKTVLKSDLTFKGKIIEFIRLFAEYYENYPAITAILHSYHQLINDSNTSNMVRELYDKRYSFLLELLKSAQDNDEISRHFSSEELVDIILGFMRMIILRWRMEGYSFPLKEQTLTTLEKILDNF